MLKKLVALLAGAFTSGAAVADSRSDQEALEAFARAFLDPAAQERISAAAQAAFSPSSDDAARKPDSPRVSEVDWGEMLINEVVDYYGAEWLDWKYNVYTMLDEWGDGTGILDRVFEIEAVDPITNAERQEILSRAEDLGDAALDKLFMPDLQPLATKRGIRLMLIDNQSDGLALFVLPDDEADTWHAVLIGNAFMFSGEKGLLADPRAGGTMVQLAN